MSPAYGYDDEGEREHDCCDVCGSGSCPGSGSGGDDACTYGRRRPAPPLSPREREIVDRFEAAPDGLVADDLCDCGSGATRAECDPAYGGGSDVAAFYSEPSP